MSSMYTIILGYLYATLAGTLFTWLVVHLMWEILRVQGSSGRKSDKGGVHASLNPNEWQTITVGIIERILYIMAIQIVYRPEFIAVWLTLKTVAGLKSWSENASGVGMFNNFLAGNGLSIMYALAGAGIMRWAADPSPGGVLLTLFAVFAPIILSLVLAVGLLAVLRSKTNIKR